LGNTPLYDSHSEWFFGISGGGQIPGPIRSAKVPPFQLLTTANVLEGCSYYLPGIFPVHDVGSGTNDAYQ